MLLLLWGSRLRELFALRIFSLRRRCHEAGWLLRLDGQVLVAGVEVPAFALLVLPIRDWLLLLLIQKIVFIILQVFLVLFWLVLVEPRGIVRPVVIVCPFFVHVFVGQKLGDLVVARVWTGFLIVFRHVFLPI